MNVILLGPITILAVALGGTGTAAETEKESQPAVINLQLADGASHLQTTFDASKAGTYRICVAGLQAVGAVVGELDGKQVDGELVAERVEGPASQWRIDIHLPAGKHTLVVREEPGLQFYRVEGTQRYLATGTEYQKRPVLDLDFAKREWWYPVELRFGPTFEPFFWFSGKWDRYDKPSYTETVQHIVATSGTDSARLSFQYVHPPRHLLMPTTFTLVRDSETRNVIVRVRQTLQATGKSQFSDRDNIEFLHVVIHRQYGRDWGDGVPDYFWNREQVDIDNDTLPGSRTHFALMHDNTRRRYTYHASTRDPKLVARSSGHHTGFGHPLYAENTIGGWFTKTGTGSVGWVMHKYQANFAKDLSPIHSHCGDGADTHIYAGWAKLFFPWDLKAGDRLDVEYTLQCLPSEVLREQVELINDYDLVFFGEEREAKSKIARWYGTKDACGLLRSDGSALILGIGKGTTHYPIPLAVHKKATSVFRLNDLRNCNFVTDPAPDSRAEIQPGWVTIVDCGSAREGPTKPNWWKARLEEIRKGK